MTKPKKKRKNKYQEVAFGRLRGNFRSLHTFFFVFTLFCFVLLLGAGLSRLYQKMINAHWLKLEEIQITGTKKLDRAQILSVMGLRRGQCILGINTEDVSERLRKLPALREASVRLELCGRITVEIVEREPVAVVKCGDKEMQMDLDGILFSEATPGETGALPLITGLCDPGVGKGEPVAQRSLQQIRELLAAIDNSKSWLSGTAINECSWTENGFTLVLGERAVAVDIGKDDFDQKIAKLRKVIDTLKEQDLTDLVTRIDLDHPGKAFLEGQFRFPRPVKGQAGQPG
jgi:cell division protein FtsQ